MVKATTEKVRQKLVNSYENLTPFHRALVQACSVVYEPISATTLMKILQKSGLSKLNESVSTAKDLASHITRLQNLRLLNKDLQCHHGILEIAMRDAVAEGLILKRDDILKGVESLDQWSTAGTVQVQCAFCRAKTSPPLFKSRAGLLCTSCVEDQLKSAFKSEDHQPLSISGCKESLGPQSNLFARLEILWNPMLPGHVLGWMSPEAEELRELILSHVGFDQGHPLDRVIRQAAFDTCVKLGRSLQPTVLKLWSTNPSHYYANIISITAHFPVIESPLKALLTDAAKDSRTLIRERLLDVLVRYRDPWATRLVQDLARDPEPSVSGYAKEIIIYWAVKGRKRLMPSRFQSSPSLPRELGRNYGPLVNAVREELPPHLYTIFAQSKQCPRLMRDIRIALYTENVEEAMRLAQGLMSYCAASFWDPHPFVRVYTNPFDAEWFGKVPVVIQSETVYGALFSGIHALRSDEEFLNYAMDENWLGALPRDYLSAICHVLSFRLVLAGRLSEARRFMNRLGEISRTRGLEGWLRFVEGRYEEAMAAFEMELKEERRRLGKRSAYFLSPSGLFFILALLNHPDPSNPKKIDQYLHAVSSNERMPSFLKVSYEAMKAVLLVRNLDQAQAKVILEEHRKPSSGFSAFFFALAQYWCEGKLSDERIDELSRVFIQAREAGMEWLGMECAQLLRKVEEDTPIRRNYVERIQAETGMASFVAALNVEEAWQRSLRALIQATSHDGGHGATATAIRLVWLLDYQEGVISLRPLEQKLLATGGWSKGRPVALSRLYSGNKLDYLGKQDELLRGAVERESYSSYYYGGVEFSMDMDKALPALVGHPLVFLESSPTVPVEIVKGEPEVLVMQSGKELNISLSMPVSDSSVEVVQESPTRYRVVQLTEEHRRIARILGSKGLTVPFSAKEEVLAAIASISSHVLVQSAIGGTAGEVETVQAQPMPYVHLLPAGSGFRIEIFVKPFGDGGPYLKPGVGAENVMAEVNGKRMQARRELEVERRMAEAVETSCPVLGESGGSERQWILDDPEGSLQVLMDLRTLQEKGQAAVEWPEGEKLRVTRLASFDQLKLRIRGKTDWFEVNGELRLDDDLVFDMRRLLELLKATNSRFLPLGEGQFLALTNELRRRLDELDAYADKKGKEIRLHPLASLAIEDLTSKVGDLDVDKVWTSRIQRIRSAQEYQPLLPSTLKAELRDYQLEGYHWLSRMAYMGMGACLADDMGLGKTIQALAVVLNRAAEGPTLVVAPTSVCMNWIAEANRFAPTLNVVLLGTQDREKLVKSLGPMDMLVASYGLLHQESELLSSLQWKTIILDEAQAIKNVLTKRAQAAMTLQGEFKLITTGTPIENHLMELWTLFNFINPGLLGSHKRFNERFALPIERYGNREARKRLKKLIQPFILRRVKSQVLEELPPRTEVLLQVEMSPEEMAFYEALRRQALDRLAMDDLPLFQKQLRILAEIMKLRQAACNPKLVVPETGISSSKLEVFGEIVTELLENRHKALVFSQFVGHLSLIREFLDTRGINYRYLDGSTPPKDRKREVDAFQSGDGDLFLISLKAGGLGLNLTAADYVIHMDPWWNPAVEDQASDRAHRIGQQHPVTIYRLVSRHTIEEKIVKLHQEKRDLAGSLLEGSDITGKISAEDLLRLIREE